MLLEAWPIREQWETDRPLYEAVCQEVKSKLQNATRDRGLDCDITSRTKDIDSLLKKALRKDYADPYHDMHDKAGVRVVCTYRDSLDDLQAIVREHFKVFGHENKAAKLSYAELGYPGIHFEVIVDNCDSELMCEVQLLTRAQSLWADISHELAYKPWQTPPDEVIRAVYLQSALVEIFDNQMAEARKTMLGLPGGREMRVLNELEKQFLRFVPSKYDRQLSLMVVEILLPIIPEHEIETFGSIIDEFVNEKETLLKQVFTDYADDSRRSPLLFQPESILIFLCMERDLFQLKQIWGKSMPLDLLLDLGEAWGAVDMGHIT